MSRIIFITGTDTGAGKTVLTALLLVHLRQRGINTLAIKPFCSGNRRDARCLSGLQGDILPLELVNPWFAKAPVAPGIGLRKSGKKPNKNAVMAHIRAMAKRCDLLLVEGAGGLLSPLGENLDARGIIRALKCPVLVAARNRLGCLNHILLTAQALNIAGTKRIKV
ncbi:MAG: dethiobiotin synthase, partial [Saprospiraceae bacterium]|nr:dethiobiotin synthase [Saprospiraceae bacterium]